MKNSGSQRSIFLILIFGILCIVCSGCGSSPSITQIDDQALSILPPNLQNKSFSFAEILDAYERLNDQQKIVALEYLLEQNNLSDREKSEAAYILARLFQRLVESGSISFLPNTHTLEHETPAQIAEQTLHWFDLAQNYPSLTIKSLWHKSEIAASLGKEKLVRQYLTALLNEDKEPISIAAAQYAMAQSYIRAGERNNANKLLNKIKTEFAGTNFAIGSDYYLGTLSYNQVDQKSTFKHNPTFATQQLIKDACDHYFQYLQASPQGRFSSDILLKLTILSSAGLWQPKENQLILMANAYLATGQFRKSLTYWQKCGANKHIPEVASCLVALNQPVPAQNIFLKGASSASPNKRYLIVANEISSHLNSADSLNFWQKLSKSQFAFQDEVLWNIAIRQKSALALRYYEDILYSYPKSAHAAEAQWWLLWNKFKSTKMSLMTTLPELFYKAAIKYNHSLLAPRFLFWAGKIEETIKDYPRAIFYYQQSCKLCPGSYYGQRANARLKVINNIAPDNYFRPQSYLPRVSENKSSNNKLESAALIWDFPAPTEAIRASKEKGHLTLDELIYLKQYNEALVENHGLNSEITAWLEGKCGQPCLAIKTASQCLEEKSCAVFEPELLRQYSFPLLYDQEIVKSCQVTKIAEPLLVHALVREESRYDTHAVSQAKALGLCQLMPSTANDIAKTLGIKINKKEQLFQAELNLTLGITYLSTLLKTFGNDGLLSVASYNAGVNAVKHSLAVRNQISNYDPDQFVEDFPFHETRDYIRKVFGSYWHYKQIY